jgi:hypothetical protein
MSPVQVNETGFENDAIEKRSLHRCFSPFPEDYPRSFALDSLVMMKPVMIIATIKSAKVMKTPENPKAKIRKAMVQSVICNSSPKNGKIVLKPIPIYNGEEKCLKLCAVWIPRGFDSFPFSPMGKGDLVWSFLIPEGFLVYSVEMVWIVNPICWVYLVDWIY